MTRYDSGSSSRKVVTLQTKADDGEVLWTTMALQGTCIYWNYEAVANSWRTASGVNVAKGGSFMVGFRPMWRT